MMKVLLANQFSTLQNKITAGYSIVTPHYSVYAGTNDRVVYPISLDTKTEYVPAVSTNKYSFAELCEEFPESVTEVGGVDELRRCPYGAAYYIENESGHPRLYCDNWDSSD